MAVQVAAKAANKVKSVSWLVGRLGSDGGFVVVGVGGVVVGGSGTQPAKGGDWLFRHRGGPASSAVKDAFDRVSAWGEKRNK